MTSVTFRYALTPAFIDAHFIETGTRLPQQQTVEAEFSEATTAQRAGYTVYRTAIASTGYGAEPINLIRFDEIGYAVEQAFHDNESAWKVRLQAYAPSGFDHFLTQGDVFEIVGAYNEPALAVKSQRALERKRAERARHNEELERKRLVDEAMGAERRRREEEREEAARRKAEGERVVRDAWVATHGSDFLKKAIGAGYDCQRRYVTERAALELPGFEVDFAETAEWRSRSCPSETNLDEALSLTDRGYGEVTVVWLTAEPDISKDTYYESEPREAIVVEGYLGRYVAAK